MKGMPKKPQIDGKKLEASWKWEGSVLCALGFEMRSFFCFVLFFKGELQEKKVKIWRNYPQR